jgi:PAS domain S-box-containing protein
MDILMGLFESFFNGDYMPHGHCYLWKPEILWINVISDSLIALAYFSIPFVLFYIIKKRSDWQFSRLFILFSLFIFMCGVTHVMGIITIWQGFYGLHGLFKFITALVSVITAIALVKLLPSILAIPSIQQIKHTNQRLAQEKIDKAKLEAHEESKRLLEKTLDASPSGLLALDQNGKISIVNQEIADMFGYSKAELIGKDINILLNTSYESTVLDNLFITKKIQQQGSNFKYIHPSIYLAKTQNNQNLPTEIQMHGEQVADEQIVFVAITDQTAKLKAEKTEAYLTAIFDSCDDPILGITLDGIITRWNKAAENLYGYSAQDIIQQSIFNLVSEQDQAQAKQTLEQVSKGQKIDHYEVTRIKKNGIEVQVMVTISPIKDYHGNIFGASIIDRDCTPANAAQQNLELKNIALQNSNKELENFAFIASHDLKEPLRKILSFGQLIQPEVKSLLSEQSREFFGYMLSAADRMQQLLSSLLSYSQISSRAKPHEVVDLNLVIKNVLSDLQLKIEETNATIESDLLPTIKADKIQIHQLFQNLIENALKYRHADRAPIIKIINHESTSYAAHLMISDNGIGFEQQYAEQIFDMFKRLHGRRDYQGTGVGLAICRKIIERHNGSIKAQSTNGEGAIFELHFP